MRVRSCDFTPVCDLCTIDPFPIPPSTQNFREDAPFPPFISTDRFFSLSPLRLLWKQQRSARARRVSRSLISRVVPLGSCTQVSRDSSVAGDLIVSLSLESGEPVNTRSSSSPSFSPPGRYCSLSFCLGVRGNPASAREYKPLSAVFCSTPEKLWVDTFVLLFSPYFRFAGFWFRS